MNDEAAFLIRLGWQEVPGEQPGSTCWMSPPTCSPTPLYFALDDAYALETVGVGIHSYAAHEALKEARRIEDIRIMDNEAVEFFKRTGIRLGVPPNY